MAVDEAARHQLYTQLEQTLGPDATSTMMSLLPPVGWADVATKDDLRMLETSLRGEMGALRGEMGALRSELRGEMSELRGAVAREVSSLESRFTTALRQQLFAIIAAMLTVSTLTVAAASIL